MWMLWTCGCCGHVRVVDMCVLWTCACCGRVAVVDMWMLWTCGFCGRVRQKDEQSDEWRWVNLSELSRLLCKHVWVFALYIQETCSWHKSRLDESCWMELKWRLPAVLWYRVLQFHCASLTCIPSFQPPEILCSISFYFSEVQAYIKATLPKFVNLKTMCLWLVLKYIDLYFVQSWIGNCPKVPRDLTVQDFGFHPAPYCFVVV